MQINKMINVKKKQKQYNKFSNLEKIEFESFIFNSEFISRTISLLDEYHKLNKSQRRIMASFLWHCYFSILSPTEQLKHSIMRFARAEKGTEANYTCEYDWQVWKKIKKIRKWKKPKDALEFDKKRYEKMKEEFNLIFKKYQGVDVDKWCGYDRWYYKLKIKIKNFFKEYFFSHIKEAIKILKK
jgi:hypothetical protein